MTMPVLINTGRAGVTYDDAGHSLGGGERIPVTEVDYTGQDAIDRGILRVEDDPPPATPRDRDTEPGASQAE
jgi:hypothetical protein